MKLSVWLVVFALFLCASLALGQQPTAPSAEPPLRAPQMIDRSTPRQTVVGLLRHVESGELSAAARYLDLRGLQWGTQTPGGAAKLTAELLTLHMWLKPSALSDVAEGNLDDGRDVERIGTVRVRGVEVPVMLSREVRGNDSIWLVSQQTVARLPDIMAALEAPGWVEPLVPKSFESLRLWGLWGWQWLALLLAGVLGYPLGFVTGSLLVGLLKRLTARTQARWDDAAVAAARRPVRVALGLLGAVMIALSIGMPGRVNDMLRTWMAIPIIVAVGWATMRATRAVIDVFIHDAEDDEAGSRGMRTHLLILRQLASASILFVTVALALTRFEVVRDLGLSLLASAGVAGVALGFAAQRSLGAAIAGLQLSITQPVRLGDAIVWQGQWGVVEEITLTWLRVKLFDERRLVVPVDKFLTEPFENWSMPGNEMIGMIELPVDATAPVDELRAELERLAAEHPSHDGRECLLQLIELSPGNAMLRGRVSTDDMSRTFAMRCDIREAMLAYLRELEGGRYLVRQRWQQLDAAPARAA